jgi:hypothetical protein
MIMTTTATSMSFSDGRCYTIKDIAKYLYDNYASRGTVLLQELYQDLDSHPVFPSDGFKLDIKNALKDYGYATCKRDSVVFYQR